MKVVSAVALFSVSLCLMPTRVIGQEFDYDVDAETVRNLDERDRVSDLAVGDKGYILDYYICIENGSLFVADDTLLKNKPAENERGSVLVERIPGNQISLEIEVDPKTNTWRLMPSFFTGNAKNCDAFVQESPFGHNFLQVSTVNGATSASELIAKFSPK